MAITLAFPKWNSGWTPQRTTGLALRISVFFVIATGIGMIVLGCYIKNPPSAPAPAFFVFLGSLNLFASIAGYWGSYNKKRVLMVYIIFAGLSLLLQIAFVISLFTIFDKVVKAIAPPSKTNADAQKLNDMVSEHINIARWVLVGFVFIELLSIVLAILLKWVIKDDDDTYRGFDAEDTEQREVALSTLRGDIEKNAKKNERAYDKIKDKMAAKYGGLTQGNSSAPVGDWKSKTSVSWKT